MKSSYLLRLHFIVFLWGFTAILGKLITVDATILVFYRMMFAFSILFIYIRYIKKERLLVKKANLWKLMVIGAFMGFHWLFFFHSVKVSNVSIALCCLSLSTLFAAILEPIIFKRKIDISEIIMGIVMVASIMLIFNAEFHYKEGIIYGILCALCGTVFSVFNGKMSGKEAAGSIIFYEIFFGWLLVSLYYCISGDILHVGEISNSNLALILLLAAVFTAYPMFESVKLMKYISPFTLILTVNLEPVYGIILAFFIFGGSEHMSPIFYIASLVMIGSIVVNGILKSRKKATAQNKLVDE